MKTILLVDGNHVAHANQHATKLTVGGMETQAIFGFFKQLSSVMRDIPGQVVPVVLWDGRAQFRFDLFPDYKGNREATTPEEAADKVALERQKPVIEKMLQLLGVTQRRHPLFEADDLAFHMARKLAGDPSWDVKLITGDKDWLQMLRPGVEWVDRVNDRQVRFEQLFEFTGFRTVESFVQGKALQGDSSDNIAGIHKLGEKTAQQLLAAWGGDMHTFFAEVDAGTYTPARRKSPTATSKHPEEALASPEGRALFSRNLALMDLSRAPVPDKASLIEVPRTPSLDKFRLLCTRLAFSSILKREDHFLSPFTALQRA